MSRRDGIENLLGVGAKVAPTVSDMKRDNSDPGATPASAEGHAADKTDALRESAIEPPTTQIKKDAKPRQSKSKEIRGPRNRQRLSTAAAPGAAPPSAVSSVRVNLPISDGSHIAQAMEKIVGEIPPGFRKNFNIAAFIRDALQSNDKLVADMIEKHFEEISNEAG